MSTAVPGPDARYARMLEEGRFCIQRCLSCEKAVFYPREICPHCGGGALEWFEPSGNGQVYSTTVVRTREDPYNISIVQLDEGPRLMTRVVDMDPAAVKIGQQVTARVGEVDGVRAVLFVNREVRP